MNRAVLISLVLLAGCSQKAVDPMAGLNCEPIRQKMIAEQKAALAKARAPKVLSSDPFEYSREFAPKPTDDAEVEARLKDLEGANPAAKLETAAQQTERLCRQQIEADLDVTAEIRRQRQQEAINAPAA